MVKVLVGLGIAVGVLIGVLAGGAVWVGLGEGVPVDKGASVGKGAPVCRVVMGMDDPLRSELVGDDYAHGVWSEGGVVYAYSATEDSTLYNLPSCVVHN